MTSSESTRLLEYYSQAIEYTLLAIDAARQQNWNLVQSLLTQREALYPALIMNFHTLPEFTSGPLEDLALILIQKNHILRQYMLQYAA